MMKNVIFTVVVFLFVIIFTCSCGVIKDDYVQIPSDIGGSTSFISSETVSSDEQSPENDNLMNIKYDNNELVRVTSLLQSVSIDIKYASNDNFTSKKIYDFDDAYLRYGTVVKLIKVSNVLKEKGYCLVIWDSYRPHEAQFKLYSAKPDGNFVSNPNKGYSSHSSGGTVDVTIKKLDGSEVEMPSKYDEFKATADRDYSDVSETAKNNALILEKAMEENGFKGYSKEWWHFSDTDEYSFDDIKNVDLPLKSKKSYIADCNEYINLREKAQKDSSVICQIPKNSEVVPLSWQNDYVRVLFNDKVGYVSTDYVK